MKILADIHTHTIASGHAYATLDENMKQAEARGLKLVAMTEHAPEMKGTTNHAFFANLIVLPSELHNVRLLKGIELNILDTDGTVDMDEATLQKLDVALASLHIQCFQPRSKKENTKAYLQAMEHPYVDILGHPGDPRFDVDYEAVFKKARETGTLLEINNMSLAPNGFRGGSEVNIEYILRMAMKTDTPIVVGSDAHFYSYIGEFGFVEKLFNQIGFPEDLVLNTDPDRLLASLKRKKAKI